jgi:Skp1 family, dimerisation domain
MLGDVFIASSYLDITILEKLVLAKFVSRMQAMTPEDMRACVDVKSAFSEDEEMRVREENAAVIDGKIVF